MADGLRGGLLGAKDEGASALTERAAGDGFGVEVASGFKVEVGEEEGLLCRVEFVTADFSGKGVVSGAGSCRVGVAALSGACSMIIVTGHIVTAAGAMLVPIAAARRKPPCNNRKTGSSCCLVFIQQQTATSPTANFPAGKYSLFA